MHQKTAGAHQQGPRLACVIGGRGKPRPYKATYTYDISILFGDLVGAHLCVRPWTEVACCSGPTHRSAPTGVAMLICILAWLRMFGSCSGRGMPRPYKTTMPTRIQERSVTWRSDLFIFVTFTHIYPPTPGPGPQARCGKGVWSPEDQGDRCRVPRSFGPSGAGGEQVELLRRNQLDDHPTKGEHAAAAATPHPSAFGGHLPLQGEGKGGWRPPILTFWIQS